MIIYIPFKLFGMFTGITLWPFIFIFADEVSYRLINHERIHLRQQRELWLLGFYWLYVWDFVRNYWSSRSWSRSYRLIRFEKEAYDRQNQKDYLDIREKHAWKKYA